MGLGQRACLRAGACTGGLNSANLAARSVFGKAVDKLFIMIDFAGITPSAILVKKWRGKPLFMALRPDLPENPLSAQIYLEIE